MWFKRLHLFLLYRLIYCQQQEQSDYENIVGIKPLPGVNNIYDDEINDYAVPTASGRFYMLYHQFGTEIKVLTCLSKVAGDYGDKIAECLSDKILLNKIKNAAKKYLSKGVKSNTEKSILRCVGRIKVHSKTDDNRSQLYSCMNDNNIDEYIQDKLKEKFTKGQISDIDDMLGCLSGSTNDNLHETAKDCYETNDVFEVLLKEYLGPNPEAATTISTMYEEMIYI